MKSRLPITIDLRTTRLIRVSQGILDARLMDEDAAKIIVRTAKAVRAFCESLDYDLAHASLDALLKVCQADEQDTDPRVLNSLRGHVGAVRKALGSET